MSILNDVKTKALITFEHLRLYNVVAGLILGVEAFLVLVLYGDYFLPVFTSFGIPEQGEASMLAITPHKVATINVTAAAALYLTLTSVIHLYIATNGFERYRNYITQQVNYYRWVALTVSSSIIIVLVAMVTGINHAETLLAIAGLDIAMIMFGLLMETNNRFSEQEQTDWLPMLAGLLVGIIPWLIIGERIATSYFVGEPLPFGVLLTYGVIFLLFLSFPINMYLHYRGNRSTWQRYRFTEAIYITLSLVTRSAHAWLLLLVVTS